MRQPPLNVPRLMAVYEMILDPDGHVERRQISRPSRARP
jgi:hypothetical protein